MDKDLLYKVAYDEAVRALTEQRGVIDSFRTRAGLLLSTAAVTTSFLGAQAPHGDNPDFVSWLALLCFVAVAVASLAILLPRKRESVVNSREVIEAYIESSDSVSVVDLHRDLSLHMHHSYVENHVGLKRLGLFFQIASGLLTLEVTLWVIAVATA